MHPGMDDIGLGFAHHACERKELERRWQGAPHAKGAHADPEIGDLFADRPAAGQRDDFVADILPDKA